MNSFQTLKINPLLIEKLKEKNIVVPTQIQQEVIPKILTGKNIIAQSNTGTGKTFSFLIPLLHLAIKKNTQTLILAPTNDLAVQIYHELNFLSEALPCKCLLLSGGVDPEIQKKKLKDNYNFIVGVPGRVLKLVGEGSLKLAEIKKIVLDEADFLIELGFKDDLESIFKYASHVEQVMVFSATFTENTKKVVQVLNQNNIVFRLDQKKSIPEHIKHYFFPIEEDEERLPLLLDIIGNINPFLCIIFVRTKSESDWLHGELRAKNIDAALLNGDLKLSQRKKILEDFKKAKFQYLVSTDLASRGLDIDSITHIINYVQPQNDTDYLHRAGRTGRMEQGGVVFSICNQLDEGYLKKYATHLRIKLVPALFEKGKLVENTDYEGEAPRFNLADKQKHAKAQLGQNSKKKSSRKAKDKQYKRGKSKPEGWTSSGSTPRNNTQGRRKRKA